MVVPSFTRKQKLLLAAVPPVVALLIRAVGATLRYRDVNAPGVPAGHTLPGPVVFAFWHCSMLTCAHRFRNLGIAILISRSFDGELIARTVERLGFLAVRGSSSRGGAAGLKGMEEAYAAGHRCAFTADGPKGPASVAKAGPVQLAELTGATWIGAYHAEPERAWRLKIVGRFVIPKPFSTVTFGWPEHVIRSWSWCRGRWMRRWRCLESKRIREQAIRLGAMLVSDFGYRAAGGADCAAAAGGAGASRMLVLERRTGEFADRMFADLPALLRAGDLLVLNDSRVMPARLFARRGGVATQEGSPAPRGWLRCC